jgi:hypothetical protein
MFEIKEIPYPSDATRFSARILDVEHGSNWPVLEMMKGIEPTNLGRPRTGCSLRLR